MSPEDESGIGEWEWMGRRISRTASTLRLTGGIVVAMREQPELEPAPSIPALAADHHPRAAVRAAPRLAPLLEPALDKRPHAFLPLPAMG